MINKHKSNKIKENSNTVRHLNNGTDHRHSKSCCDQSSPARGTINILHLDLGVRVRNRMNGERQNEEENKLPQNRFIKYKNKI